MSSRLFYRQLLNVDAIRTAVAKLRWHWYVTLRRQLRMLSADGASTETVPHNLKGMVDLSVRRSLALIRPLVAAVTVSRPGGSIETARLDGVRILSVGPRTEGELLNLVAHGFEPKLVKGLDLISYSPWVDLGDMHAMPYADSSWDAIILGWVLAYSDQKQKAVDELIRVARNGAIVAVGVEYCCLSNQEIVARYGYQPGSKERLWCLADILRYFEGRIDRVYFQHDVPENRRHEEAVGLIAVFSIRK